MTTHRKAIIAILVIIGIGVIADYAYSISHPKQQVPQVNQNLPVISLVELSRHNGTDPNIPIYIGLDGYVYDVTPGKEYYVVGGQYHDIAGKDSSAALQFIGGDIIKQKYRVVGRLPE